MTIPSQGSRKIVVGDREFMWLVRKKPTYCQGNAWTPMRVAVQLNRPGARGVLLASVDSPRPDNWMLEQAKTVTPALVRRIIKAGTEAGWDPEGPEGLEIEVKI